MKTSRVYANLHCYIQLLLHNRSFHCELIYAAIVLQKSDSIKVLNVLAAIDSISKKLNVYFMFNTRPHSGDLQNGLRRSSYYRNNFCKLTAKKLIRPHIGTKMLFISLLRWKLELIFDKRQKRSKPIYKVNRTAV